MLLPAGLLFVITEYLICFAKQLYKLHWELPTSKPFLVLSFRHKQSVILRVRMVDLLQQPISLHIWNCLLPFLLGLKGSHQKLHPLRYGPFQFCNWFQLQYRLRSKIIERKKNCCCRDLSAKCVECSLKQKWR